MRPRGDTPARAISLSATTTGAADDFCTDTDYWYLCDSSLFDLAKWQSNVKGSGAPSTLPVKWPRSEGWPDGKMEMAARLTGWGLGYVFISTVLDCTTDEYCELFRDHPELEEIVEEERMLVRADNE
ncbi:hypothetical protein ACJZ2D_002519 [Fusarium nematophilum]